MWNIELTELAKKNIKALDKQVQRKIIEFLHQVEASENPRSTGHVLKESRMGQYWSYKVMKDYRVIARIQDQEVTVIVVSVGNRKNGYNHLDRYFR